MYKGYTKHDATLILELHQVAILWVMVASHCQSDQLDQAVGDWSSSLSRSGWGGLPCSASIRVPIQKITSRDPEAKRLRSHQEVIGYWLSRGRVDLEMRSNTSLKDLSKVLEDHGRHSMLSFLSSLPISVLRILDTEANKFYDRNH